MPRKALVTIVICAVALTAGAVLMALGPPQMQFWRCQDNLERPTPHKAAAAYYEHCWSRGTIDTDGLEQNREGWDVVRSYGIAGRQGVSFIFIGRRTPTSGWTVIEEASGP